jgi:hypothetical protein
MRFSLVLFAAVLVSTNACWFQSKKSAFRHITHYLKKKGMDGNPWDPSVGITRKALHHVVNDAPGAVKWIIKKVHGVDGVMKDCDANNDGFIYIDEAKKAKHCVDSCWKQLGIQTFLN